MDDPLLANYVNQDEGDTRNATSQDTTRRRSMLKMSLTIPTKSTVEDAYSDDSWRKLILNLVFSRTAELATAGLILLDVVFAFIELFLMAEYPSCDIIEKYATSCCPYEYTNTESAMFDRISGFTSDDNLCKEGLENRDYDATCDENDYPDGVHTAHVILFSMSMIILSIFVIELLLVMIAMGMRQFFGNIYYTLDFIIVSISVIEVIIFSFDDHFKDSLAGFMMLFRLWRLVRIGHGVLSVDETLDTHLGHTNSLETKNRELKMLLQKNNVEIPDELDKEL